MTSSDSWSSVPCVADGAVGSTSMMVGPRGPGATSSVGGMVSTVVEPRGARTAPAAGASTMVETGGQELLLLLGPRCD